MGARWETPLEEKRAGPGHHHIEGYCALLMGRTWSVKQAGCQGDGTDDPAEPAAWRTSLPMVRELIRSRIF